jgi:pimeloyl-ACP methyl ester carboxylesterase
MAFHNIRRPLRAGQIVRRIAAMAIIFALPLAHSAAAAPSTTDTYLNFKMPTLGGIQFWTDIKERAGWRLQCHAFADLCRVLDAENYSHGWGVRKAVAEIFDSTAPPLRSINLSPHAIILVHGLGGKPSNFEEIRESLQGDGYRLVTFNYASAFSPLENHGASLGRFIGQLENVSDITFVTHSMGGRVVDSLIAHNSAAIRAVKIHGVARLGPPHHGSTIAIQAVDLIGADHLSWSPVPDLIAPSPMLAREATLPQCNIVGSLRTRGGVNPMIDGDDDGIIGRAEASTATPQNTLIVETSHLGLTSHPAAINAIRYFVETGSCTRI